MLVLAFTSMILSLVFWYLKRIQGDMTIENTGVNELLQEDAVDTK